MEYKLSELLNIPKLQNLLDDLDAIYSIPSAIIDMEGNILTGTAWQDVCTKFHRLNPQSEKDCVKSDTYIVRELSKGRSQVVYKCPRGLIDTATPLLVDGKHIGNAFTGQFFLEPPDEEYYRKTAREFGFDEQAYIEAVRRVPIVTEETRNKNLKVLASLTEMLAEMGLQQKRQKEIEYQLQQKNKDLEQIVYVSSHDLRTPLVNIDGYSREIKRLFEQIRILADSSHISQEEKETIDAIAGKEIPEAVHYISTSVTKMDALLSGLLQISRLGRLELRKEPLDMDRVIADIFDSIRYRVELSAATVDISELPSCFGDRNQINQLFSNIIENALKYLAHDRPGTIRISGRSEDGVSIYCVEDNGIGIPPDNREKIFDMFYQLNPKQTSGEGLGLTIVKKIIETHQGKIWIESAQGIGTQMYVSLPNG